MRKLILVAFAVLATVSACKQKPKEATKTEPPKISTRAELLQTLTKMQTEKRIMFGQHDATLYGHTWTNERGRCDVKDVCGDYPAVIGFDLGGIEIGDAKSLDFSKKIKTVSKLFYPHFILIE